MDNDKQNTNGLKSIKRISQIRKITYLDKHNFLTNEMNEIIPKYKNGFMIMGYRFNVL